MLRNPSFEAAAPEAHVIEGWRVVMGQAASTAIEDAVAGERVLSIGSDGLTRLRQAVSYRSDQPALLRLSAQVRGTGLVELRLRASWQLRDGDASVRSFARGVIVGDGQWAVQQAAIQLLARDDRNLPRQGLHKLAVESPDWHVSRAAARVLAARGEAVPEDARTLPEQPQTLVIVAAD